ncbi:hypothetical protein SAMN05444162_2927 [Paenibacillaceae bacterium GAS479]|nr:hypothetical protein SAMN05444162_2927 [Paenibacillaceae bacterium GAS479]
MKPFQSTLPHGERPYRGTLFDVPTGFNPRSRTGSDSESYEFYHSAICFNPRSRTGSDF